MYENMSPSCRWIAFGILLGMTLVTGTLTSRGPNAAKIKLFRFELCATTERAQQLMKEWEGKLDVLRTSTLWDFLFILSYTPLLMLLCAAASRGYRSIGSDFGDPMYWFGLPLGWAVLAAGICDVVENIGMLQTLANNGAQPWPAIAATASAIKWCIVFVASIYALIGILAACFHLGVSRSRIG